MGIFSRKKKKETAEEKPQIERPGPEVAAAPAALSQSDANVGKSVGTGTVGDARAYQVILAPHQTEKAGLMAGLNKYVFRVGADSNKIEIRRVIEKLYKVKVDKVAVLKLPAKARRLGRTAGFRPGFKKAIVTLVAGEKIDVSS